MIITGEVIQDMYGEELTRCSGLLSIAYWVHAPRTECRIVKMRALGRAGPAGGVKIGTAYLGTDLVADLRDTIRHELAHMAAGVQAKHGPEWRRMAQLFGATARARSKGGEAIQEATARASKYTLIAVMECGRRHNCGGRARKTRKYADYSYRPSSCYKLGNGERIVRFEYVTN